MGFNDREDCGKTLLLCTTPCKYHITVLRKVEFLQARYVVCVSPMYSPHLANTISGLLDLDTGNCAGVMGLRGVVVVLKQFRLAVEFTLDIEDAAKDSIERRLLHALLDNPVALRRYVQKTLVSMFDDEVPEAIREALDLVEETEEILDPVINSMSYDDAARLRGDVEAGYFGSTMVEANFALRLERAEISE